MIPPAIRATVRDYIRAHDIFRPGPLVVAVSGGADSTALLLLLADLAPELGLVLHVAHFDHRTRPKQSAADADFVATLANSVGAPIRIGRAARAPKSEDEARRARYEFLRRAATEIGATAIATGHTRDDQAETVLLHLVRGAGLGGLAGIRPLRDGLARPLLAIARRETVAVCRAARVKPRTDPTNRALRFARNRVRLKVLPELAKINPRVVEAIARLADAAAETSAEEGRRTHDELEGSRSTGGAIDLNAIAEDLRGRVVALAW
ncbi:MAG TPA: tRNA lysidine(34) synthetase TilS, partial [Candidatus Limnocylindria bacterium]